jgi:two-component system cell cycle response regulator DivK
MANKILVVEDNEDMRRMLVSILEFSGYEISQAATGVQAIEIAVSARPNLIILDLELPDMPGVAVAKAIRKNPTNVSIPIIGWSAYLGWEHRQAALDAGMVDYLEKPVRASIIRAKIEEYLFTER